MPKNPSPVLLDRLAHVLERQGLKLSRTKLLETAAYAFGFRNSNEFTAAAKSGEINPPYVEAIARVGLPNGSALLVVNDPLASSPYGIDESFIELVVDEERREQIGVTPYGHLVRLDHLGDIPFPALNSPPANQATELAQRASDALSGYTAEDSDSNTIGQAENALSRAIGRIQESDSNTAIHNLKMAQNLLKAVSGKDDPEGHLYATEEAITQCIAAINKTQSDQQNIQPDGGLSSFLEASLEQIDLEIENRKAGGDPEAWADLQAVSDLGHRALRNRTALTPMEGDNETSIRVSRADLSEIIAAASSYAEDVSTGLEEGLYDAADNPRITDLNQSILNLELRLAMKPTKPNPVVPPKAGTIDVYTASISHKHGHDNLVALNEAGLDAKIAAYCRENWDEVSDFKGVPSDPDGLSDKDISNVYFNAMSDNEGEEHVDTNMETLPMIPNNDMNKSQSVCDRCGTNLNNDGTCGDETCPFSDCQQNDPRGWEGHPEANRMIALARKTSILAGATNAKADELADILESGITDDVWYDASEYGSNNPNDPDRIAEGRIETIQNAMQQAAILLRALKPEVLPNGDIMIDGMIPSVERISRRSQSIGEKKMIFITDDRGEETGNVTINMIGSLGLPYRHDREDTIPLTDREYEHLNGGQTLNQELDLPVKLGFSVLWEGRKWMAPEIEFSWDNHYAFEDGGDLALERAHQYIEGIRPTVEALGGHLSLKENATETSHELLILLPFELANQANTNKDWLAALSYLFLTESEKEDVDQVTCEYTAEADVHKYTQSVNPLGDTEWNGTFDALLWGSEDAEKILSGESDPDEYAHSPLAPQWVRDWSARNPFTVNLTGLEDLFKI